MNNELLDVDEYDYIDTYVTFTDPNQSFIPLQNNNEFNEALEDSLDIDVVTINKIYVTKLIINLKGYKEDVIDSVGIIVSILLGYGISAFTLYIDGIEKLDDD